MFTINNVFGVVWAVVVVLIIVILMSIGGTILMIAKIVMSIGHFVMTDFDAARDQYREFWPWVVAKEALKLDDDIEEP